MSDDEGSQSGDYNNDEEYEIEEILDYNPRYFDGAPGFFVKWKGYAEEDNSWVTKEDAEGAQELIDEFLNTWKKKQQEKRARKSAGGTSGGKSGRKSEASISKASSSAAISSTKRRRQSENVVMGTSSEDEVMEDVPPPKKSRASKRRSPSMEIDPPGQTEDEEIVGPAPKSLQEQSCWEHAIKHVDTVERDEPNEELFVYFTLQNGNRCRESAKVCKEKFPRILIDFYESNLRWRTTENL